MNIKRTKKFEKTFDKLDNSLKLKVIKQIEKIIVNPLIGKPMKYDRKDTRELYVKPFRISYNYFEDELTILFLNLYHKDKQ
jgi:mRNA-degrading endonuclease RelE of RelBE toxin-antitoxin system